MDHEDLVEVSVERFTELEKLERSLPDLIAKAITDYKKENLRRLHEKEKNNPEAVRNRVKKYISKNRDKINEKRRLKRKEKLLAANTEEISQRTHSISSISYHTLEVNTGIVVSFND
jgi:gas vesicle protein